MNEWLEDDIALLAEGDRIAAPRVLDPRVLSEPVSVLPLRAPVTVPATASILEAIRLMRVHRIGCVLVTEDDVLRGILTERDILLKVEDASTLQAQVATLMTREPETLSPDAPIVYALNKMSVGGFRHVPLVGEDGRLVAIVSVKDVVDYLADVFATDVLTVPPDPLRGERWRGREGG